jgi:hypothetical protein
MQSYDHSTVGPLLSLRNYPNLNLAYRWLEPRREREGFPPGFTQGEGMDLEPAVSTSPMEISRARRYEIGTSIRYRVRGEREWHEGVTENISISGMLIRADRSLDPRTAVEMRFFLPVELDGECAAEVFCRGLVIRSSKCRIPANTVTIAVKIAHSRFIRQMDSGKDVTRDATHGNRRLAL